MALSTIYDFDPVSPPTITREEYSSVGSSINYLGEAARGFKADTFQIHDAPTGGTELTIDVDYEILNIDTYHTGLTNTDPDLRFNIYTRYRILNAAYQSVDLYFTYQPVLSYNTAEYANNTRSKADTALAGSTVLKNYITGLEISNNSTDSDHDIDIAVGIAADDTQSKYLELATGLTKQIDANWTKGTNAGGLDTGTVAINTFYYFWGIEEDSTGDIDVLISSSQTSPTMPSGWTAKRRIRGAILTDGSANILGFRQKDNDFRYNIMFQDANVGSIANTSRNTFAVNIPPNMIGKFVAYYQISSSNYLLISETTDTDNAPTSSYFDLQTISSGTSCVVHLSRKVNSSSQIAYRSSATGAAFQLNTQGFIDNAE